MHIMKGQHAGEVTNRAVGGVQGHECVQDVIVTTVVPEGLQVETSWCLDCLETVDALQGIVQLLPGTSVSVRVAGV